jgi:hypothetical protein
MKLFFIVLLLIFPVAGMALDPKNSYVPSEGIVPTKEVAIKIAEAVLVPIYGKEKIESEKPFNVELKDGVWCVTGSIPKPVKQNGVVLGGVFIIEIAKNTGEVISVGHEK